MLPLCIRPVQDILASCMASMRFFGVGLLYYIVCQQILIGFTNEYIVQVTDLNPAALYSGYDIFILFLTTLVFYYYISFEYAKNLLGHC